MGLVQVLESSYTLYNMLRCLTTLEPRWYLSMLLLALMAAARCLSLPGGRPSTATNSFIVSSIGVRKRRENRGIPSLQKWKEQGYQRSGCWCCSAGAGDEW